MAAARDPYRIWVSEVMLQQTQVKTALRLLPAFPGAVSPRCGAWPPPTGRSSRAGTGLGYYARARNLQRRAAARARPPAAACPTAGQEFRALPGVGDYIAAAVLSIAFDRPHAVVDGNVRRVLARLLALDARRTRRRAARRFQSHADRLLDRARPGDFNQAVMELGRWCAPRGRPPATPAPSKPSAAHGARGRSTASPPRACAPYPGDRRGRRRDRQERPRARHPPPRGGPARRALGVPGRQDRAGRVARRGLRARDRSLGHDELLDSRASVTAWLPER